MHYRLMTIDDYDAAVALWRNTEGAMLIPARALPAISLV